MPSGKQDEEEDPGADGDDRRARVPNGGCWPGRAAGAPPMSGAGAEPADRRPVHPTDRERLAVELARRYYLDDESTPELAEEYGVSRSTISRLIALARERGWVRIEVIDPLEHASGDVRHLLTSFDLVQVVAVPTRGQVDTQTVVARRAAAALGPLVPPGATVGVAWGTTSAALAQQLSPLPVDRCRVVQLNGASTLVDLNLDYILDILGRFATAWGASMIPFPVPAFFDLASSREALWRERSISRVREIQMACDIAVFSVGSTSADVPSRVYAGGYLRPDDRRQLQEDGAIGDIATYFFRADGTSAGIRLNERASGLPLDLLAGIPVRFCVAAGDGKAEALLGALEGGYVTHLVADETLINRVVELHRQQAGPAGESG